MQMHSKCILRDSLETFKHLAECYGHAAFESDSDNVRETFLNIMRDKCELQAAVFNLMHQMGDYRTKPAEQQTLVEAQDRYNRVYSEIQDMMTVPQRM